MSKSLVALGIAVLIAASFTVVAAPSAHADGFKNCADYEFVALRGSGESSSDLDTPDRWSEEGVNDEGAGLPLDSAWVVLHKQLQHMGYTSALDSVNYEAVAVGPAEAFEGFTDVPGPYTTSVDDGVANLTKTIDYIQSNCPDSKIILGGYSQGAQVIDEALNMKTNSVYDQTLANAYVAYEDTTYKPLSHNESSTIAGVLLFGDPKFDPSDKAADQSTFIPSQSGIWLPHGQWSSLDNPSTVVVSYCHFADPICNGRLDLSVAGIHQSVLNPGAIAIEQAAAGEKPVGDQLFGPHTDYQYDKTSAVTSLLEAMNLRPVSSSLLGISDDLPTDTAYLIDDRSDMWQDDPNDTNASESAHETTNVTYMDHVAHAIDEQIAKQSGPDNNARWSIDMFGKDTSTGTNVYPQGPFNHLYVNEPTFTSMNQNDVGGVVPSKIWTLETQNGGQLSTSATDTYGSPINSYDYNAPTDLNATLLLAEREFAGAHPDEGFTFHGPPIDPVTGHRFRVVVVSDHPNDLTNPLQVQAASNNPDDPDETWNESTIISRLIQEGVSISFWNPIPDASTSSYKKGRSHQSTLGPKATVTLATSTTDSPNSADIAQSSHGTSTNSADGLDDIAAYAALQPVDQITGPATSYTGQEISATSSNTEGDGLDQLDHTDWTVTGPDGSTVDTETTSGGGPLQFTPSSAGTYTISSTITLHSGYTGTASWADTVSDAPTAAPAAPTVTASVDSTNNLTLTWAPSANATFYTIYDSNGNVLDRVNPIADDNGNLTWSQALPTSTGDVSYTVTASNEVGESAPSAPAETTLHTLPPAVPAVSATVDGSNNVTLTWPVVTNATSFTVYDSKGNVLDHLDPTGDANGNVTWNQSFPDQFGQVSYTVSASNNGGESAKSAPVKVSLHDLSANVPDATGSPGYSGTVDNAGVPTDGDTTTTSALQTECGAATPTENIGFASDPFKNETATAVGDHAIRLDFQATNQQLCDLYDNAGLPSSEIQNVPLSVDPNNENDTYLIETLTSAFFTPQSAYISVGAATDGLTSTRSISVLMNFDSNFNAADQATELQSEIDQQAPPTFQLGFGESVGWIFYHPAPPPVPDGPTVTPSIDGQNNVTLTWPSVTDATSYTVYDSSGKVLDQVDPPTDGSVNVTWSKALPDQTGQVTYAVSASDGPDATSPPTSVTVTLHNLNAPSANVPDATGNSAYSGTVDGQGVPTDNDPAVTTSLQSECQSGTPTENSGSANGPFDTETATPVGDSSIRVDFTVTNQQLCDMYDNGGLPSSEFQDLPLSVDQNYGNYTALLDTLTGGYLAPQSAYVSAGPATDGLDSTRSFSVLMNFDSSFNAADQATELQSEMDQEAGSWIVWLGIGHNISWTFQDPAITSSPGAGAGGGGGGGGGGQPA